MMEKELTSPQHPTIHSIQYLRAVAALMVVFHHLISQVEVYENVLHSISVGAAGVDVFFVISGFVIWFVTYNKDVSAREFFTKRIIRVVPIYWCISLTIIVAATIVPQLFKTTQFEISQIFQSLFFIPHYSLALPGNIYPILVPGWTLNYEIFFYLVFGGLLFLPRHRQLIILAIFSALVVIGFVWEPQNPLAKTYTSGMLLEFVAGVFIAKAFTEGRLEKLPVALGVALALAGLVVLLLTSQIEPFGSLRAFYWGVPAALLVLGVIIMERAGVMPKSRILHLLGDASYSIYLTHIMTLGIVRAVWSKVVVPEATFMQISAFIILGLLATIVAGLIFHFIVEKPLTRFLQKRLIRKRVPVVQ